MLLVARGLAPTRRKAQALVLAGRVHSGPSRLDKPGHRVPQDVPLAVDPGERWVSRAGGKLAAALDELGIRPEGDVLDVGASTGGFTQVLLERGARAVIALDVGRGQLDWGLRRDPRVHVVEGVNARHLSRDDLPCAPSLATIDVSFISLELVLPPVVGCLVEGGEVVALVKPQFEVGRGAVGRGGIVRDPALHRHSLNKIATFADARGWGVCGVVASQVAGAGGNREFFVHIVPRGPGMEAEDLRAAVDGCVDDIPEAR